MSRDSLALSIYRLEMTDPGQVVLVLLWAIDGCVENIVYKES